MKLSIGVTVEALVERLDENCSLLSIFDESQAFFNSFGLYKATCAAYEKSVYLELHNGSSSYNRSLKSKTTRIDNPRFNLALFGHPGNVIQMVKKKFEKSDDGLLQRFLISAPDPVVLFSTAIMNCKPITFDLSVIFSIAKKLNTEDILLTLDNEASVKFNEVYDFYKTYISKLMYDEGSVSYVLFINVLYLS